MQGTEQTVQGTGSTVLCRGTGNTEYGTENTVKGTGDTVQTTGKTVQGNSKDCIGQEILCAGQEILCGRQDTSSNSRVVLPAVHRRKHQTGRLHSKTFQGRLNSRIPLITKAILYICPQLFLTSRMRKVNYCDVLYFDPVALSARSNGSSSI